MERKLHLEEVEAQARAGARLVSAELEHCENTAEAVVKDGEWWPFFKMPTGAWDDYREPLARTLDADACETVASTVNAVRYLAEGIEKRDHPTPIKLTRLDDWKKIGSDVSAAVEALRSLTGDTTRTRTKQRAT